MAFLHFLIDKKVLIPLGKSREVSVEILVRTLKRLQLYNQFILFPRFTSLKSIKRVQ